MLALWFGLGNDSYTNITIHKNSAISLMKQLFCGVELVYLNKF